MLHKLKIKKEYYELVRNGMKPFEIRKNDRNYQTGDFVSFIPVNENGMIIPHNKNKYLITYVFNGGEYGLNPDYCVFGISEWRSDDPRIHKHVNCRYRDHRDALDIVYELIKSGMLRSEWEEV